MNNDTNTRKTKKAEDSVVTMTELVLPTDTNLLGNLLGGRLLHMMDICGALTASRHSNSVVATVAIDRVTFKHPVPVGSMVIINSKLISVGNSSMTVIVSAESENLYTGERKFTNEATFVFVALDENERPKQVPLLEN